VLLDRPLFDGECARDLAVTVSTALRDKHLAGSPASGTEQVHHPIELLLGGERALRAGCRVDQHSPPVAPVDILECETCRLVAMKMIDV